MRVLLYCVNFAPETTGIGKYCGEMATWLAANGHSVRVVTAPPYYPAWKVDPAYSRIGYRREQWKGVDIWRTPLWVPKAPGGIARVLHLLSFAVTSFPVALWQVFWRPDLVLTVAPAFMCAPAGLLVARLGGAQSWLHLQDFEIDLAFRMGLLKGRLLQSTVLRMERWLLRRFDLVSSISGRMIEQLLKKGVDQAQIRYLPNWVDIAHVKPSSNKGGYYRSQLGISPESIVILFSGSLGGKQGLMVIPDVAKRLVHRKDIVFVVCGDGVMKPELEEAAAGLSNFHFLPLQPFERLGELLCTADIHLLPQSLRAADLVLPSKLSGMLASGRPVIATCEAGTELAGIVSLCGKVVPPQDGAALADVLLLLADDLPQRLELGRRARAYAEVHFERDFILGKMFGSLDDSKGRIVDTPVS